MYTSLFVLAFSGFTPAANADTPTWLTSYPAAAAQSAAQKKPLAVFLAAGSHGWEKLAQEGNLSNRVRSILASQYICVHIDTATSEGKRLARGFEIPSGLGIVISDRTGQLQAFSHEGDLTDVKMVRYLQRYSDPSYVVFTTETNPSGHVENMYPPPGRMVMGRSC